MAVTQTQLFSKISTAATFNKPKSNTVGSHRALSIRRGGAYSSQKGLAPWRGQCHQPSVGVPPLRPAGLISWATPPNKKLLTAISAQAHVQAHQHTSDSYGQLKITAPT